MDANKDLVVYEARDGQEIKLSFATIKKYLVQGHPEYVTDQEMVYYMGICKSRGINPFNKDCYLMKYSQKDNAALIVSIDYKRKLARIQKDCQGWQAGIIVERNGQIIDSNGLILEGDKLLGGWFEAQPEGFSKPRRHEVNLTAYIKKTVTGEITAFWKKEKQPMMIAKVAESQGLTMIWPGEFAKLYTPEEMGEADMFKSTENAAPGNLNDKLKGKASTEAKEDIYEATVASEPEKKEEEEPKEDPLRAAYIKLQKKGFKPYVETNLQAIGFLPQKYQIEIRAKWKGFYPDEAFPVPVLTKPVEEVEEAEPPGDPGTETQDEKILRLVTGAEFDQTMGQPTIPCPGKKTKVGSNWCLQSCEGRETCKPWGDYNKEEDKE